MFTAQCAQWIDSSVLYAMTILFVRLSVCHIRTLITLCQNG